MDLRFVTPGILTICGSTNTGKMTFSLNILAHVIDNSILELFTVLSHHGNIFTIYQTQFLFGKHPIHRSISIQSTYIILFKNPRDSQQIEILARQMKARNYKYIIDSYLEATKKPYSYILIDNHQRTDDRLRIRSRILPHEWPMVAWIQKQYHKSKKTNIKHC